MNPRAVLLAVTLSLAVAGLPGSAGTPATMEIAPCDTNRFMMTMTRGILEVVHVYPAATADTSTPPIRSLRGEHTELCAPRDLAVDSHGQLHAMNRNSIATFARGAAGDAAPTRTLNMPALGIGLDRRGNTYAVTWENSPPADSGSITVFERGADGDRRPVRILSGRRTGLHRPTGVAVDGGGRIFASNQFGDTVRIFGPGANGDVAPVAYLAGPHTELRTPYGLAFDRRGFLYVANENAVTVYAPGSSGDTPPARFIEGQALANGVEFRRPTFVTIDSHDTLYVASNNVIWVYGPAASGKVSPTRSLRVPDRRGVVVANDGTLYVVNQYGTVSVFPAGARDSMAAVRTFEDPKHGWGVHGLALGTGDTLYVGDPGDTAIRVYPPGARGVAIPTRTLSGPETRISDPAGIVMDRHGMLYVANGPQPTTRGAIRVYGPEATDTSSPHRVLKGRQTHLSEPMDVAVDRRGNIYAVNRTGSLTVYSADAEGDAEPIRIIAGPNTLLREPRSLAIGLGDTLYVLNAFGGTGLGPTWKYGTGNVSVTVYSPSSKGDVEPVRTITVTGGPTKRGGRFPTGIAVDARGSVYLSDYASNFVSVYAPGAGAEAVPSRWVRIGPAADANGRDWTYMGGTAVAIGPRDELFVAAFPQQMVFTRRQSSPNEKRGDREIAPRAPSIRLAYQR